MERAEVAMARKDPESEIRALHSYNLVIRLEMPPEQRADLLDRVLQRAGQKPLGEALAGELVARGPVEDFAALRGTKGVSAQRLRGLAGAFADPELGEHLGQLLQEMTGVAPSQYERAEIGPVVIPEPVPEPAPAPEGSWDVVFFAYDPQQRRHRLTLLRAGASVEVEADAPAEPPLDAFAEQLLSEAADAPPDAQQALEECLRGWVTPPCPRREELLAQLQREHGPFAQLYALEFAHRLPAPTGWQQAFSLAEPDSRADWGQVRQELRRQHRYRLEGTALAESAAEVRVRWVSADRFSRRGGGAFHLPLLALGAPGELPVQAGWQVRAGWEMTLRPLVPGGAPLQVTCERELVGELRAEGAGQLQEHLYGRAALFAALYDARGCLLHTGAAEPAAPEWAAGVGFGAGALTVNGGDRDRDLSASGLTLEQEVRPLSGVQPRLTQQAALYAREPRPEPEDVSRLEGSFVLDQQARVEDARALAQCDGEARSTGRAGFGLALEITDGVNAVRLRLPAHPGEGEISALEGPQALLSEPGAEVALSSWHRTASGAGLAASVGDQPRSWRLQWRAAARQAQARWRTPLEFVTVNEWMDSGEAVREAMDGWTSLALEREEGGYWLEEIEGELPEVALRLAPLAEEIIEDLGEFPAEE